MEILTTILNKIYVCYAQIVIVRQIHTKQRIEVMGGIQDECVMPKEKVIKQICVRSLLMKAVPCHGTLGGFDSHRARQTIR